MSPNETRVAGAADPKTETACSFVVADAETADASVVQPPIGGPSNPVQQVSRFQLRKRLGRGGFGSVFLAYDPTLDREIALKIPRDPSKWTDESIQRFLDEARLAARLKHPHVITVYDAGCCKETGVFIATEYVEGETLAQRLSRGKPSVLETVRWCSQIAAAIHEAHRLKLFHRDLKPSNILLDRSGNAKVCDFGLALHEDSQRERRGEVSGTHPYMSPEQVQGDSHLLDGRTDIWSLGVILYECLAGQRPFRGDTPEEIHEEILTRDPRPLRQLDDTIPEALDQLCASCFKRNLAERLRTARDFTDSLTQLDIGRNRTKRRLALSLTAAILLCASVPLLMKIAGSAKQEENAPGINLRGFVPVDRNESLSEPDRDPLGVTDMLCRAPTPFVFNSADVKSHYSYMESTRRLVVASPNWSVFSCGRHRGNVQLDAVTVHGERPATVGVFWGLHPEISSEDTTQQSCLAAVVEPDWKDQQRSWFRLYRLTFSALSAGRSDLKHIHEMARSEVGIKWTVPVALRVKIESGKLPELTVQNDIVPLKIAKSLDGDALVEFSVGESGLIAYDCQQQVVFTRFVSTTLTKE
jgi:serine/threonine protein kinase